jgi:GNAT superfamily N-acetyltransferase
MAMITDYVKKGMRRLPRLINRVMPGNQLAQRELVSADEIMIAPMTADDIDPIVAAFTSWGKTQAQYERYFNEQRQNIRILLVAWAAETVIGYGTLIWESPHEPLRARGAPEIMDLNVKTRYQGQGIGSALIAAAEREVKARGGQVIGISVEQTPNYAAANRLYPKLGYQPVGHTNNGVLLHLMKTLP